jgi:hypothetical protein
MQYILLIYDDEKTWGRLTEAEQGRMFQEYADFTKEIVKSGHHRAGEALQPTATAASVRQKDGKAISTDGPHAETKEQLGGFYLIEAKDRDDAVAIAGRVPSVRYGGTVEVRPILPTSKPS